MRLIFAGLALLAATSDAAKNKNRVRGGCNDLTKADVASDLQSDAANYSLKRKNQKTMVLTCNTVRKNWTPADKTARKEWKKDLRKSRKVVYKCINNSWSAPGINRAPRCPSGLTGSWASFKCHFTCANGTPVSGGEWGVCSSKCHDCNTGFNLYNEACVAAPPPLAGKTVSHPIYTKDQLKEVCNNTAFDLFVLVDGSGSVQPTDYRKSIDFVEDLVDLFHVGPHNVRVSLIQYSNSVRFYGIANGVETSVNTNLENMRNTQFRSGTRTNHGLWVMHNYVNRYKRQNVPTYVLVITDGYSYDGVFHATKYHNDGIPIFGLGVGRGANERQLNHIATDPDSEYKYMLGDFNALNDIRVILTIGSNVCYNGYKGVSAVTRSLEPTETNFTVEPEDGEIGMTPEDLQGTKNFP